MMEPLRDVPFPSKTAEILFGEIWNRPQLSIRDRRLLVIGATAMLGRADLIEQQVDRRAAQQGVDRRAARGSGAAPVVLHRSGQRDRGLARRAGGSQSAWRRRLIAL